MHIPRAQVLSALRIVHTCQTKHLRPWYYIYTSKLAIYILNKIEIITWELTWLFISLWIIKCLTTPLHIAVSIKLCCLLEYRTK